MRYVIAIGGNALTDEGVLASISRGIGRLYRSGNSILVTHGNGPQVGKLAAASHKNLALLTEETEASIGLQVATSLERRGGLRGKVEIIVTRAEVNPRDAEFRNPSKPIGRFYTKAGIKKLNLRGRKARRLIGGYRIVVPSPKPIRIPELEEIQGMLKERKVVIAGGGGGVAVNSGMEYMDAVIDKDYTSALLAKGIFADRLIILTNVDGVYLDFSGRRMALRMARSSELARYIRNGEFERGSMLPKVEACVSFVRATGGSAAIGSLGDAERVLKGRSGTRIRK